MAPHETTTVLHFNCACGKVQGFARVPTFKLPLPVDFCHCNSCRHQSGLLCASYLTLPDGTVDYYIEGPLNHYESSSTVTRTFCNHCGANIHFQGSGAPRPDICTGVLDKADGVLKLRNHIFVPDSKDGGFSDWIPDMPAFEEYSQSKEVKIAHRRPVETIGEVGPELQAFCHCGNIRFKITRPNDRSKELIAPYPDLLLTHPTRNTSASWEKQQWWIRAGGGKYLAGACACQSCRLTSGFDIQMWAFVPRANILQPNGDAFDFGKKGLKQYESSDGVRRYFCAGCGATVFWGSDGRPGLVDISVGLLESPEGARAESWLEWCTERVSFEEEAQNKDLVSRLSAGLKIWGALQSST